MTELIAILQPADLDQDTYAYIIAPADGYYTNIEIIIEAGTQVNLADRAYFGYETALDQIVGAIVGEDELYYHNTDRGFLLITQTYGGVYNDPLGATTRKHWGKKRLYVKAGDRLIFYHNALSSDTATPRISLRAKFKPQKNAFVEWYAGVESLDTATAADLGDLNGMLNHGIAYQVPITYNYGSVLNVDLIVIESGGTAVRHGKIVFYLLRNKKNIMDTPSTALGDQPWQDMNVSTSSSYMGMWRDIIGRGIFTVPKSEIRNFQFSFRIPQMIFEGDIIAYELVDDGTGTGDEGVHLHLVGSASGHSNYRPLFIESNGYNDMTEIGEYGV